MKRGITDLRVAALQTALHWEDAEANIKHIQHHISLQEGEVDLIVLPEMWSSGFSMRPEHVAMDWDDAWIDQTDRWPEPLRAMRRWSQEKNAAIVGSISCRIKSDDRFVNRCFFVSPTQDLEWYDKRHLFGFAGEDKVYTAGKTSTSIAWRGWTLHLQVCYDLRFPVFSRNTAANPYDVVIYVANWPAARIHAWQALLQARAIENQCYAIGVNRVGADGNGIEHNGLSQVIHPKGHALALAPSNESTWLNTTLSANELLDFRSKFPVLEDGDSFEIKQRR